MDFIGHDVNYFVTKSLHDGFFYEARYRPSKIQEQLVLAKHFGKKSGKGFYNYS
jgi:3-hydroxybutyryl-CoA dehydrogenase